MASYRPMVMRRAGSRLASIALAVLLAGAAHATGVSREVPYKDLARIALMMDKVDKDHVFSGEFSVAPAAAGQPLPADLRVEVLVAGKAIAVQVDAGGRMHLPIRQDWVDADARVRVNQPRDKVLLSYDFRARPPPGTRMRYSRLAESAAVMARGIEAEAGWLGFMAPEPYALDIRFPPGPAQVLEIRFADGATRRWHAIASGAGGYNGIELPWKPEWREAEVTLSAPVGGVIPLVK